MKYDTLKQLKDAIDAGHAEDIVLMIDNDTTGTYEDNEKVFEMHPYDLLEQALDLLGIPHEHV